MRVSTSTIYALGVGQISQQQTDLLHTQQMIATGRRILSPGEDPVAAASVLELTQSMNVNEQNGTNATIAKNNLIAEESHLMDVTSLIQDIQQIAVNAGGGTLTDADRNMLVAELEGRYKALVGIANVADENGQHLFSGFKGATVPFAEISPGNVVYNGDQGQRTIRISANNMVAISDSGADIFQRIKNGNGVFVTSANAANTGSGVIGPGSVLDITKWNAATNKDISIKFDVSAATPPVTTYDIVDNVTGNSLLTGAAAAAGPYLRTYTSDGTISLKTQAPPDTSPTTFDYGGDLTVSGAPATGDTFSIKPSTNQDLFSTLSNLIAVMKTPASTVTKSAVLHNGLGAALSNLSNALDNVLTVRASVGARLKEVDAVQSNREDMTIQYQAAISHLQDVDYAKSISDLTLQQIHLEAAQKSFSKTQSLTLFNYIGA